MKDEDYLETKEFKNALKADQNTIQTFLQKNWLKLCLKTRL